MGKSLDGFVRLRQPFLAGHPHLSGHVFRDAKMVLNGG
jgi:hypothetical protein